MFCNFERAPLILIVGPSGVGKDSLINGAQRKLVGDQRFVFPRRFITRPSDHGGEDHIPLSLARFESLSQQDGFMLHWRAHGFAYGIPATVLGNLCLGRAAVVNASRAIVDEALNRFRLVHAIHVTASPTRVADRLVRRGRETPAQIAERLSRTVQGRSEEDLVFDNDGPLSQSIDGFVRLLEELHDVVGPRIDEKEKESRHVTV